MKIFNFLCFLFSFVAMFVDGGVGLLLADPTGVPTGTVPTDYNANGKPAGGTVTTSSGAPVAGHPIAHEGIATETLGREVHEEAGDSDFYQADIEGKVIKVRPMSNPLDQISRYASNKHVDSFEVKYYSVGTRPVKTKVLTKPAVMSGTTVKLAVQDPSIFTKDDTIFVPSVKAKFDYKGTAYNPASAQTPCLELIVVGRDTDGQPLVYAVNGNKHSNGQNIVVPDEDLTPGTILIRGGKACGELDVQTGRFTNHPLPETQFLQNFMLQVEQSTFDKIASKIIDWNFSDIEEDGVYDFRRTVEKSYLFGTMNKIKHDSKEGALTWTTGGIWWMAGKDLDFGTYNEETNSVEVTDNDLIDFTKDLFVGTGVGNKRKILLMGSNFTAAAAKVKSDKFIYRDTVELWDLKFKSWDTDFGEVLGIYCEAMDDHGLSDYAFALDPEYLGKRTHVNFGRTVLDLKKAGVRNTDAVVFQEVSGLILRYPSAHARVRLGQPA